MSTNILALLNSDPTRILTNNEVSSSEILQFLKTVVDPILRTAENKVLDELFVEGLDSSQVWPQVKMVLDGVIEDLSFEKIPKLSKKSSFTSTSDDDQEEQSEADDLEEEEEEGEEKEEESERRQEQLAFNENDSDNESIDMNNLQDDYEESDISDNDDEKTLVGSDEEDKDEVSKNTSSSKSELDDDFFNIDEFNKQILSLDKQANGEEDDDEEEIDYFNDIPESDDEEILYFQDFFNKPRKGSKKEKKKVQFEDNKKQESDQEESEEGELDEEEYDTGMSSAMRDMFADEDDEEEKEIKEQANLSSFERQQLEIQQEISKLEKEAVAEKKWALKGESKAKERPADSLLQEELEFERTAKPVPVITKEITESLEEMIRRRIKEGIFDDLPKRTIEDLNSFRKSSKFELSEEKSQKSLAELYEDDYKGSNTDAVSEELSKSHDEIKELFKSVTHKLDALSSAHFIPKPVKKALDIKVEASAISMEDATPLSLSDASRLAPQEIYKPGQTDKKSKNKDEIELRSGVVMARSELDREEKQRLRRANKRKRSKEFSAENKAEAKKSKKQDAIDTLSKANNVTIIDNKGVKRDVKGNLVKEGGKKGSSQFRL